MTLYWSARTLKIMRYAPVPILAAVMLLGAVLVVHAPAMAEQGHFWSLRDLFLPRREERIKPPREAFPPRPRIRKPRRVTPAKPVEPAAPTVEKAADARNVLVVGDFMAGGLAEGLQAVFADNPSVRIIDRSKGSSGFVRDDFYDWPKEIGPLLKQDKPAVVAVMIGSNDRQSMTVGGTREATRSEGWTKAYEARVAAFGKIIHDDKIPLLWVGMPPFKPGTMTADMLAFNDIYRSAAQAVGGEYVDIWDGFVDENGTFVFSGPDVNGQPVRLRGSDGINMTKAGKRKVAFYAEKPLLKLLGLTNGAESLPKPGAVETHLPGQSGEPASTDRTPPMPLNDPTLDGDANLLGASPQPMAEPGSPMGKLAIKGIAPAAPSGRADHFDAATQSRPPQAGEKRPLPAQDAGQTQTSATPEPLP
jgi:hypothetical protein